MYTACLLLPLSLPAQALKNAGRGLLRSAEAESVRSAKNASAALEAALRESVQTSAKTARKAVSVQDFKALGAGGAEAHAALARELALYREKGLLRSEDEKLNQTLTDAYEKKIYRAAKTALNLINTPEGVKQLEQAVKSHVTEDINYIPLIPSSAKMIYVGEIHDYTSIYREVETMIRQYRAAYPDRTVYLLAESVAASVPVISSGSPEEFSVLIEKSLMKDKQMDMYYDLAGSGVKLGGLDLPNVVNWLNEYSFLKRDLIVKKYRTLVWVARRNVYFKRKIDDIRRADPNAVIFVYGGKAHFNYLMPYNVPDLVGEAQSVVLDFSMRSLEEPIGFQSVWNAWRKKLFDDEVTEFGHAVRRVQDPATARLFGSDLRIELEN